MRGITEQISIFLLGFFGWWVTGVDDLLIFGTIIFLSRKASHKMLAFIGLQLGFMTMIAFSLLGKAFIGNFSDYGIQSAIPLLPIGLGVIAIRSSYNDSLKEDKSRQKELHGFYYLVAAYGGYIANCSDDFVYNVAVISSWTVDQIISYVVGLWFGSCLMAAIPLIFHKRGGKDKPFLRGVIMILVGVVLELVWLEEKYNFLGPIINLINST